MKHNDILHALTLLFSIQFCKVECIDLNIREFHQDTDSLLHPPNSLIFKSVSNF